MAQETGQGWIRLHSSGLAAGWACEGGGDIGGWVAGGLWWLVLLE